MRSIRSTPLLLAAGLACGCLPGPGEVGPLVPEITMEGVSFRVDRGGSTRAVGEAERVTYRRDTTAVVAQGLVLTMPGADGEVVVTAPSGRGNTTERRFEVSGGIRAARRGDLATTGSATFEPSVPGWSSGRIEGREPLVVTGPGYRLDGRGFTLDPGTGDLHLSGGARLVTR
jgi:hypothetical protein